MLQRQDTMNSLESSQVLVSAKTFVCISFAPKTCCFKEIVNITMSREGLSVNKFVRKSLYCRKVYARRNLQLLLSFFTAHKDNMCITLHVQQMHIT